MLFKIFTGALSAKVAVGVNTVMWLSIWNLVNPVQDLFSRIKLQVVQFRLNISLPCVREFRRQ